jgi:hypothetical protein
MQPKLWSGCELARDAYSYFLLITPEVFLPQIRLLVAGLSKVFEYHQKINIKPLKKTLW